MCSNLALDGKNEQPLFVDFLNNFRGQLDEDHWEKEAAALRKAVEQENKDLILQIGARIIRDSCIENKREFWESFNQEVRDYKFGGDTGDRLTEYHMTVELLKQTQEAIRERGDELKKEREKLTYKLQELQHLHGYLAGQVDELWNRPVKDREPLNTVRGREKQLCSCLLSMTRLLDTQNREISRLKQMKKI